MGWMTGYKMLVAKPKSPLGRPKHTQKSTIIKMKS